MTETIFALSSGAPPAAIGVIRISGPQAGSALCALTGKLPAPRRAAVVTLRDAAGEVLDRALALWMPGPATATGEDMAELHCHGGRAVIASVEAALAVLPKLRRATSGEFTRRAFVSGKIDLAEAEGLADLLSAETELQRKSAMALAGGAFSREVEGWRRCLLDSSAAIEAMLDFADEDDAASLPVDFAARLEALRREIADWLTRPRAEVLREGFRVVLAGPPNSGKSTLFNALVESEAAITAPIAGTTRDVLTQTVATVCHSALPIPLAYVKMRKMRLRRSGLNGPGLLWGMPILSCGWAPKGADRRRHGSSNPRLTGKTTRPSNTRATGSRP